MYLALGYSCCGFRLLVPFFSSYFSRWRYSSPLEEKNGLAQLMSILMYLWLHLNGPIRLLKMGSKTWLVYQLADLAKNLTLPVEEELVSRTACFVYRRVNRECGRKVNRKVRLFGRKASGRVWLFVRRVSRWVWLVSRRVWLEQKRMAGWQKSKQIIFSIFISLQFHSNWSSYLIGWYVCCHSTSWLHTLGSISHNLLWHLVE